MDKQQLKIIGYIAVAIMILNIILFSFTIISWKLFWMIIILGAIFVYYGLPKLKK